MERKELEDLRAVVEAGYRKLAFGPVGDAVRLMLAEEGDYIDCARLDLFNLAEIRRGKGTIEMTFFDRLEALDRLAQLAREEEKGEDGFYAALKEGARALYQGEGTDAGA